MEIKPNMNKNQSFLSELVNNKSLNSYKNIFLSYTESLIKYIRIVSSSKDLSKINDINKYIGNGNNSNSSSDKKFILIVDDEKMNIKSIKTLLKQHFKSRNKENVVYISAKDGIEGLFILLYDMNMGRNIEMIISDKNMAFLDGIKFLEIVNSLTSKKLLNEINLVLFSAENLDQLNKFRFKNVHVNLLTKPCDRKQINELFDKIKFL